MSSELAWLAGIIDGEGCIYAHLTNVGRNLKCPTGTLTFRIEVHTVSGRMVDAMEEIYRRRGIAHHRYPPKMQPLSKRPAHKIQVERKASVLRLAILVLPYLRVKDSEAKAVIEFLTRYEREAGETRSTPAARVALIEQLRHLKTVA